MNQIELRRQAIADRFAHAWNKSATRYPIPLKEYRALLDLWEAAHIFAEAFIRIPKDMETSNFLNALEKLQKIEVTK